MIFDEIFVRRLAAASEIEIHNPGVSDLFGIDLAFIPIDENVEHFLTVEVCVLRQMDRGLIAVFCSSCSLPLTSR